MPLGATSNTCQHWVCHLVPLGATSNTCQHWVCGDKKGNKPELLHNAILVLLATYHCKPDANTAAKYIKIYIDMQFFCLFAFEKHSVAQEKRAKHLSFLTLLKKWLQIASTTTASAFTWSCLALVWLGTVACQMLRKVVKLAASCQVTQDPGEWRCINMMWQYQIGCLHSYDIHHSVFLLSKEVTVHDPFKKHGPGRVWTRRGGGPFMWMVHFSE